MRRLLSQTMPFTRIFNWLRGERKTPSLPEDLWQATLATLPFINVLDDADKLRLKTLTESFLAQKEFTSAGGLTSLGPKIERNNCCMMRLKPHVARSVSSGR